MRRALKPRPATLCSGGVSRSPVAVIRLLRPWAALWGDHGWLCGRGHGPPVATPAIRSVAADPTQHSVTERCAMTVPIP